LNATRHPEGVRRTRLEGRERPMQSQNETLPNRQSPFANRAGLASIAGSRLNKTADPKGGAMDLTALREAAIDATARALYDKPGIVPSEESDEWEEEYRRKFAALKQRYGSETIAPPRPAHGPAAPERHWPELSGTPEQKRWAGAIRNDRLREIEN